ncbi:flagellin [Halomonas mongoliensis]|uniref:flagellin n=1 Tax=Halomonas mongoliensis TaxID=321265 RepID=UPI00403B1B95
MPDGVPHTYINLVEVDQEIRLKKPANPLAALDRAISFVDSKRSHLGAMENRLASVIESHDSANISLSSARSRILDADYATETANMVRAQILQQAGSSMLAQANVMPENVLALLG